MYQRVRECEHGYHLRVGHLVAFGVRVRAGVYVPADFVCGHTATLARCRNGEFRPVVQAQGSIEQAADGNVWGLATDSLMDQSPEAEGAKAWRHGGALEQREGMDSGDRVACQRGKSFEGSAPKGREPRPSGHVLLKSGEPHGWQQVAIYLQGVVRTVRRSREERHGRHECGVWQLCTETALA